MNIPLEYDEQCNLVYWLQLKKLFFFAPTLENNSHKQNRKYAMIAEQKAKKAGKIKGTPDLFVFLPDKILIIELKRQKKTLKSGKISVSHTKVSKEQQDFLDRANLYDYSTAIVCYGWKEARDLIEKEMKW